MNSIVLHIAFFNVFELTYMDIFKLCEIGVSTFFVPSPLCASYEIYLIW